MLSTKYRLELTDICCRMITDDGVEVSLEERIQLNKYSKHIPFVAGKLSQAIRRRDTFCD